MLFLASFSSSCKQNTKGRIYFNLNGGTFSDPNFNVEYLEGVSNTPVRISIPDPIKEGYTFVSWREKLEGGNFIEVRKIVNQEDNNSYYYYPYGNSTLYAYFEPRMSFTFNLTEGANNAGEIVNPIYADYFQDNKLNGYTNMKIVSSNYLPTATAKDMSFDYWYLKKPLIKQEDDVSTKYVLDNSKEDGIYRFEEQFNLENMVFPYDESQQITLYAKWTSFPTITIHFNLPNINTYQFKAQNRVIKDDIYKGIEERLNVDFSTVGYHYYDNLRYAGLYLDNQFTEEFYLDTSIVDLNLDLYIKWEKQVNVTLDYNGGKVDNNLTESFIFYENDILDDDFFFKHTPTKANTSFKYFTLNNKEYITSLPLSSNDITLLAIYDDDLSLSINFTYPDNYTKDKLPNKTFLIKKEDTIESKIEIMRNDFNSSDLKNDFVISKIYYLDENNKEVDVDFSTITNDITIYIKLLYQMKINIYSYLGADLNLDGSEIKTININKSTDIDKKDYSILSNHIIINDVIYLPYKYYLDSKLTKEISFPFSISLNDKDNEMNIYMLLKEGVKLTFYDANNKPYIVENNSNVYYAIKNSLIDFDNLKLLKGKTLIIRGGKTLSNYFPAASCDIIVS